MYRDNDLIFSCLFLLHLYPIMCSMSWDLENFSWLVYFTCTSITVVLLFVYQVFWTYIVGMLSNLESLPLERIHSMLRMFAMQGTSGEITIDELKHFLDKKVKDQSLTYSGGVYRLPKPSWYAHYCYCYLKMSSL